MSDWDTWMENMQESEATEPMEGNSMSDESNSMSDESNNNTPEGNAMSDNDAVENFEKLLASAGIDEAADAWGQGYDDETERKLQAHVEKGIEENASDRAKRVDALDAKAGSTDEFYNAVPTGKLVQTLCMTSEAVHAVSERVTDTRVELAKTSKAVTQTIKAMVKEQDNMSMLKDYVSAVETSLEGRIEAIEVQGDEGVACILHDSALEDHDNRLTAATLAIEDLTSALDDLSDASKEVTLSDEDKAEIRNGLRSDAKEDLAEWLDNNVSDDMTDRIEEALHDMDLSQQLDMEELGKDVIASMDDASISLMATRVQEGIDMTDSIEEALGGLDLSEHIDMDAFGKVFASMESGDLERLASKIQEGLDLSELASEVTYEIDMWDVAEQVRDNMDMDQVATDAMESMDMGELAEKAMDHMDMDDIARKVRDLMGDGEKQADADTKVHTVDVDDLAFRVDKLERVFHSMRNLIVDSEAF